MRLDLHVHSRRSPDSSLELTDILQAALAGGLQGFALTDHNTIDGLPALRELAARYPRHLFLPGVEVSTVEGHLLVYGVDELPPIRRPLAETLDWARARGLTTVLAHPFRRTHGVGDSLARTATVNGLETLNGHNRAVANARAAAVAAERRLGETGGSDGHRIPEVGRAYTEIEGDGLDAATVLDEIARGRGRPDGRSATALEGVASSLRSAGLRIGRGFRPI